MSDDHIRLLLGLYADLSRLELDVLELERSLAGLAADRVLNEKEHLRASRAGVDQLITTLADTAKEITGARSAVAAAIAERRPGQPVVDDLLVLYRDVTRAEHDVTQLTATVDLAAQNPALRRIPQLHHLVDDLGGVQERLGDDRGIMREIEQRLSSLIERPG
jgi:hypothetical protein